MLAAPGDGSVTTHTCDTRSAKRQLLPSCNLTEVIRKKKTNAFKHVYSLRWQRALLNIFGGLAWEGILCKKFKFSVSIILNLFLISHTGEEGFGPLLFSPPVGMARWNSPRGRTGTGHYSLKDL